MYSQTIRVSEHKRGILIRYLQAFPQLSTVDKVILFGSAKEERCSEESDIDLCFVYDAHCRREFRREENLLGDIYVPNVDEDRQSISSDEFDNLDSRVTTLFRTIRNEE